MNRYNLMPNNFHKCKRRIGLSVIQAISVSQVSEEFAVHVPDEYDYRLKSVRIEFCVLCDCS